MSWEHYSWRWLLWDRFKFNIKLRRFLTLLKSSFKSIS